jgi:hypothetical protein
MVVAIVTSVAVIAVLGKGLVSVPNVAPTAMYPAMSGGMFGCMVYRPQVLDRP